MTSETVVIDLGTSLQQVQYLWGVVYQWIYGAAGVVALASLVAATWKKQEGTLAKIQDIINILACNWGYAKNADNPK